MSDTPLSYNAAVLFVDDSKLNNMMGKKILMSLGLEVSIAENGQQAIELCEKHIFQLILMDLEMPEIGGLEAAATIREKKLSFAPIYALTGTNNDKVRRLCQTARMNGIIEKPFNLKKIVPLLNKLFKQ